MFIYNCYAWYISKVIEWELIKIKKSLINILSTFWEHDLFLSNFICIKLEFYSWITCWAI